MIKLATLTERLPVEYQLVPVDDLNRASHHLVVWEKSPICFYSSCMSTYSFADCLFVNIRCNTCRWTDKDPGCQCSIACQSLHASCVWRFEQHQS